MTVRRFKRWLGDRSGVDTARQADADAQRKLDSANELCDRAEALIAANGFADAIERSMRRKYGTA
ncbi:hypothetical protein PP298_07840 [Mycobacteroides abscessus]|uniref:hypothetical protein n=1 Tax=Mycobacteroides abscessus TaxID=36809 RepID=UPI00078CD085|nr:hypothetical protein [Mycobacteroides abscessus]AMU71416.1 hypothetical protein A3O05_16230 [Mycobacteroides abscessus]MDM2015251.1 hypothetical protein [Mycobacteroides abscessus]MDM2019629.1 hypothetical protein [Mycobacteroides abscessus]MDM2025162.1 hypothetical protein [Mycobacteroides abscessus]MDM2027833.1 hypothetical protein [Mycobacteroides abscessus]